VRTLESSGPLRAVAAHSVSEFPAAAWDTLAKGSFYAGHAWATYQERDPDCQSWVVAVLDGDELIAAATLHLVMREANATYDLALQLSGERRPGDRVLLCGNRRGYDNRLLAAPGRPDGVALLWSAVCLEAARAECDAAWWPFLDDTSAATLSRLSPASEPWLLEMSAVFELAGDSFEDFVESRSKSQRERIRKDRRLFQRSGRTIREPNPAPHLLDVAALVTNVESRHGKPAESARIAGMLGDQLDDVGSAASLISCFDGEDMVACSLNFESSEELAVRVAGLADSNDGTGREYFETVYYRPIERAYARSRSIVHLGTGTLQAKQRRGATLRALWAVPVLDTKPWPIMDPHERARCVLRMLEQEEGVSTDRCQSPWLESFTRMPA
jgi:hypothetical protein